jgi:hypothetical protein
MRELTVIELCEGVIVAAHAVFDRALADETRPSVKTKIKEARDLAFESLLKAREARLLKEESEVVK